MKLVVTNKDNCTYFITYDKKDDNSLERLSTVDIAPDTKKHLIGNVYIGRVSNIVKNIGLAFVDISKVETVCVLLNEMKNPICLNAVISDKRPICVNDLVIIQVTNESVNDKKPRGTFDFELASEYMILKPTNNGVAVSSKINDADEKFRLKEIARDLIKNYVGDYTEYFTVILRTNSAYVNAAELQNDFKKLVARYISIVEKARNLFAYSLLSGYETEMEYKLDAHLKMKPEIIICDEGKLKGLIDSKIYGVNPETQMIAYSTDDMNALHNIDIILSKALERSVWLKSGGDIVIEQTESLVAIDVNSKKAINGNVKDKEKAVFKVNCEAAVEIARQLMLKNLSGIIIVDFIDMKNKEFLDELARVFSAELKKDSVKAEFIGFTKLNLAEVTRRRVDVPLAWKLRKIDEKK